MQGHWSELVDFHCDLRGTFNEEFAGISRGVDIARDYLRDLRFPLLLQELTDEVLDCAAMEADGLMQDDVHIKAKQCPTVMALTLSAYSLLHGEGDVGVSIMTEEQVENGCVRVGAFILMEKMRRMNIYSRMVLPFDPWCDESAILCEGEDPEKMQAFLRWLGYSAEEAN
jgi:hypothetical protein